MVDTADDIGVLGAHVDGGRVISTEHAGAVRNSDGDPILTSNGLDTHNAAQAQIAAAEAVANHINTLINQLKNNGNVDKDDIANLESLRSSLASSISSAKSALNSGNPSLAASYMAITPVGNFLAHATKDTQEAITEAAGDVLTESISDANYYAEVADKDFFDLSANADLWREQSAREIASLQEVRTVKFIEEMERLGITDREQQQAIASQSIVYNNTVKQEDVVQHGVDKLTAVRAAMDSQLSDDEKKLLNTRIEDLKDLQQTATSDAVSQNTHDAFEKAFPAYAEKNPLLNKRAEALKTQIGVDGAMDLIIPAGTMTHEEAKLVLPEKQKLLEMIKTGEPLTEEQSKTLDKIVRYEMRTELHDQIKELNKPSVQKHQEVIARETAAIERELSKPAGERDLKGVLDKAKKMREDTLKTYEVKNMYKEAFEEEVTEPARAAATAPAPTTATSGVTNASAQHPDTYANILQGFTRPAGVAPADTPKTAATGSIATAKLTGVTEGTDVDSAEDKKTTAGNIDSVKLAGVSGGNNITTGTNVSSLSNGNMIRPATSMALPAA